MPLSGQFLEVTVSHLSSRITCFFVSTNLSYFHVYWIRGEAFQFSLFNSHTCGEAFQFSLLNFQFPYMWGYFSPFNFHFSLSNFPLVLIGSM